MVSTDQCGFNEVHPGHEHYVGGLRRECRGRGGWVQTYTGKAFYLTEPDPSQIDPVDIAHALSMICRYGGHVSRFYSVAEHSVLISRALPRELALRGLLHDATEAYVGDVVRPLKHLLPEYRRIEDRLMNAICARFGIPWVFPPEVKEADNRILRDERAALMTDPPQPWDLPENVEPLGVRIECWSPQEAKERFLAELEALTS